MTRQMKIGLTLTALVIGSGFVFLGSRTMCACTPALQPVAPPTNVSIALDSLSSAQERYYSRHGRYTDSLDKLDLQSILAGWGPDVTIANERGFDLELRTAADSVSCTYTVRRPTDGTPILRRASCYRAP